MKPMKEQMNEELKVIKIFAINYTKDLLWTMRKQLQKRIKRLLKNGEIKNNE
jgi:hypothetical protein